MTGLTLSADQRLLIEALVESVRWHDVALELDDALVALARMLDVVPDALERWEDQETKRDGYTSEFEVTASEAAMMSDAMRQIYLGRLAYTVALMLGALDTETRASTPLGVLRRLFQILEFRDAA